MNLWPLWSLIQAMDVLFVFSMSFSVALYSQIHIFMRNKLGMEDSLIFSESVNLVILWIKAIMMDVLCLNGITVYIGIAILAEFLFPGQFFSLFWKWPVNSQTWPDTPTKYIGYGHKVWIFACVVCYLISVVYNLISVVCNLMSIVYAKCCKK